jgi:SAM-dependent methyltransferase
MSATAKMLVLEESRDEESIFLPTIVFNKPASFAEPAIAHMCEAVVSHYECSLNAADGVVLHLGAGRGELMETLREHGFSVMGCEPAPRPTRLAGNPRFDALTFHYSSAENFLQWVRRIGQKAQAVFFRHTWEHNLELQALLPRMAEVLREDGRIIAVLPSPSADYPPEAHRSVLNELAVACASSSSRFKIESVDCDSSSFMAFVLKKIPVSETSQARLFRP